MRYLLMLLLICGLLTSCGVPVQPTQPVAQQNAQPSNSQPTQVISTPVPTPTLVTAAPTTAAVNTSPTSAPQAERTITINEPVAGATITSPVAIKGGTNFWPFEATLAVQVKDAAGNVLGIGPLMVQAPDIGQGGPFDGTLAFTAPASPQNGTLEVFETSAKDGSIVVIESVAVQLGVATSGIQLDAPTAGQQVTLPLHVALRGAEPGSELQARLRFNDGQILEQPMTIVGGSDGVGYGVLNMAWNTESAPPPIAAGSATFELTSSNGTVLKRVDVQVLADAETQLVDVAWAAPDGEQLIVFQQSVPQTPQIASAALRALLNGPPNDNAAGADTAIPTVEEIINAPNRGPNWGYEVKLLKLTIVDGIATANFSKELAAYGGGSARAGQIQAQIERTLKQFAAVQQVQVLIDGQGTGILEP